MGNSIQVGLKRFATLARGLAGQVEQVTVDDGTTVGQLLDACRVPRDQAKLIFVNGIKRDTGWRLQDGDQVGVFPPVGGG